MLFTERRTKMTIIDKIIEIIDKPQAARLLCPYSGLVFLAMVLIYKDVSGINLRQASVIKLLRAAASEYNFKTSRFATENEDPVTEPVPKLLESLVDKGLARLSSQTS